MRVVGTRRQGVGEAVPEYDGGKSGDSLQQTGPQLEGCAGSSGGKPCVLNVAVTLLTFNVVAFSNPIVTSLSYSTYSPPGAKMR